MHRQEGATLRVVRRQHRGEQPHRQEDNADLDGNGVTDTSVTWAGLTQAQLPTVQYAADYVFFG